jgi:hypothetical protein
MTAIDNLLNNAMILPLLVVMGGMATWEAATSAVHVEVQAPEEEEFYPRAALEGGGPHSDRPLIEGGGPHSDRPLIEGGRDRENRDPERESRIIDRSASFVDVNEASSRRR